MWNWDISFGNILSMILTVGAITSAIIGGYIRYEKKFLQMDEKLTHSIEHQLTLAEGIVKNGVNLDKHSANPEKHLPETDRLLRYVPRTTFDFSQSKQDQRIQEVQADIQSDLGEIKEMVRENGRINLEQYRILTSRIDKIQ